MNYCLIFNISFYCFEWYLMIWRSSDHHVSYLANIPSHVQYHSLILFPSFLKLLPVSSFFLENLLTLGFEMFLYSSSFLFDNVARFCLLSLPFRSPSLPLIHNPFLKKVFHMKCHVHLDVFHVRSCILGNLLKMVSYTVESLSCDFFQLENSCRVRNLHYEVSYTLGGLPGGISPVLENLWYGTPCRVGYIWILSCRQGNVFYESWNIFSVWYRIQVWDVSSQGIWSKVGSLSYKSLICNPLYIGNSCKSDYTLRIFGSASHVYYTDSY